MSTPDAVYFLWLRQRTKSYDFARCLSHKKAIESIRVLLSVKSFKACQYVVAVCLFMLYMWHRVQESKHRIYCVNVCQF